MPLSHLIWTGKHVKTLKKYFKLVAPLFVIMSHPEIFSLNSIYFYDN